MQTWYEFDGGLEYEESLSSRDHYEPIAVRYFPNSLSKVG